MEIHEILTALAAIIGAVAGCYSLLQQKRKVESDAELDDATAADVIQGASKELISQYKIRAEELVLEIKQLREQIIVLQQIIIELKEELRCLRSGGK